jgi:ABC-2 type transport system permease protein
MTTTAPAITPARPRILARLLVSELRLFLREPAGLFWGLGFPVVLLVVLGLAASDKPEKSLGGLRFIVVYTPTVMVFSLAILSLSALPITLTGYREKGYLRRLATTPVGAVRLLAAQLLMVFVVIACVVIAIAVVARLGFSVPLPRQVGGFVLAMVLGAAAMLGLGTLVSALAPTQRVAGITGSMLFFPSMFFAGLWVPRAQMGAALRTVSDYSPLGAAVAAVQQSIAGQFPSAGHLAVLAGWALVLCLAAGRFFRWDR